MEAVEQKKQNKITLTNQSELSFVGVSKVLSSTESEISLESGGENIEITGDKMTVTKLDLQNGILEANGNIHQIKFSGNRQKENFLKRIFG